VLDTKLPAFFSSVTVCIASLVLLFNGLSNSAPLIAEKLFHHWYPYQGGYSIGVARMILSFCGVFSKEFKLCCPNEDFFARTYRILNYLSSILQQT
jgi:hypothetical protein